MFADCYVIKNLQNLRLTLQPKVLIRNPYLKNLLNLNGQKLPVDERS
jgi:hypothetical protein